MPTKFDFEPHSDELVGQRDAYEAEQAHKASANELDDDFELAAVDFSFMSLFKDIWS